MALTRKYLKALGIEEDKIDQIIEAHTETVNSLKQEAEKYKADAEKLPEVQKQLDAAAKDGYKEKYESEKAAHEALKTKVAGEQAHAAKEKAIRAYYESKNITGKDLNIAMRGTAIDSFEMDGEKLKDTKDLDELIAGDFASLVSKTEKSGVNTEKPPVNTGSKKTREEIMAIKDGAERRKAIAENPELFGIKTNNN